MKLGFASGEPPLCGVSRIDAENAGLQALYELVINLRNVSV